MLNVTQAHVDLVGQTVCIPMSLTLNFALLQYLLTVYHSRWRELRVAILLCCAVIGFTVLIPAHIDDARALDYLSTISEVCISLTFLAQLSIFSRDVYRKMKMRTIFAILVLTDLLVLVGLVSCIAMFIELLTTNSEVVIDAVMLVVDRFVFWYVVFFRFYFIAMAHGGVRKLLETRKLEILAYLLFAMHEYPFLLIESATDLDLELLIQLTYRVIVIFCIALTIYDKFGRRTSLKQPKKDPGDKTTAMMQIPVDAGVSQKRCQPLLLLKAQVRTVIAGRNRVIAIAPSAVSQ
ncbi:TPA: hypothetical protein N0F65_000187 [Lagenidium giganteum]|uniref:Uncharacterized protein n=1 Tax=Lagenidium giganteum TaxID=4803 RepID=A0AAV2YT78_9STRA|nr:TPA: hypothetical protein N0F65_000187 [Lagenidium giganteum]